MNGNYGNPAMIASVRLASSTRFVSN